MKRGIITADKEGRISNIEDTGGDLYENGSVEFHNGIIIPGFVNCHCHLELSHMKGIIPEKSGLAGFLRLIRTSRDISQNTLSFAESADAAMYSDGAVLCADICNSDSTFGIKKRSRIKYISLLEVFGIDPAKALHRFNEIKQISEIAEAMGIPYYLVPHSVYSLSLSLFSILLAATGSNKITSMHFMETDSEKTFLKRHEGTIMDSYKESGLYSGSLETVKDHATAVLDNITSSGNLILVHNTYTDEATVEEVSKRGNIYWCLCPNSNLYIEDKLPPLNLLIEKDCRIVIGTDSLASNKFISILEEIKTLQFSFPGLSLEELIKWATLNGAKALGEESSYGTIEKGKKPGLLLLQDIDLHKMKLLPESNITRLL